MARKCSWQVLWDSSCCLSPVWKISKWTHLSHVALWHLAWIRHNVSVNWIPNVITNTWKLTSDQTPWVFRCVWPKGESSPANPNPLPLFLSPPSHSFLPLRISSNSKSTMWSRSLHTSPTYNTHIHVPSGHIEGQCATLPVTSSRDPGKWTNTCPRLTLSTSGYCLCYNTNLLVPSHKVTRGRATKEITPSVDGLMWVKLQTQNPFVKWTFILSSNLHAYQFIGLCLNFY